MIVFNALFKIIYFQQLIMHHSSSIWFTNNDATGILQWVKFLNLWCEVFTSFIIKEFLIQNCSHFKANGCRRIVWKLRVINMNEILLTLPFIIYKKVDSLATPFNNLWEETHISHDMRIKHIAKYLYYCKSKRILYRRFCLILQKVCLKIDMKWNVFYMQINTTTDLYLIIKCAKSPKSKTKHLKRACTFNKN